MERMNKPNKALKHFDELLRPPRTNDTFGLGHNKHFSSTKVGESSNIREQRNTKSKGKPKCHHCGKLGLTTNICKRKNGMKVSKPKSTCNYFNCKKEGHQEHECWSNKSHSLTTFKGNFYNYHKYGHRAYECRFKIKYNWTPEK